MRHRGAKITPAHAHVRSVHTHEGMNRRTLAVVAMTLGVDLSRAPSALAQSAPTPAQQMELSAALRPHVRALRACHDRAPRAERTVVRAVHTLTAEISADGRVASVQIAPSGAVPVLTRCVRPVLDEVRLTPTNARAARTYVFTRDELRDVLVGSGAALR